MSSDTLGNAFFFLTVDPEAQFITDEAEALQLRFTFVDLFLLPLQFVSVICDQPRGF